MSAVPLQAVKQSLRQTQSEDDELLQRLLDAAETECARFLGVDTARYYLTGPGVSQDVVNGVILIVQADYDGEALDRDRYRAAAEALWMPYAIKDRLAL